MRKNKFEFRKMVSMVLIMCILLNLGASALAQSTYYDIAVIKGTQTYEVQPFNEGEWAKTVTEWFKGDCNKSGARSKITTRAIYNWSWGMYDVFLHSILPLMYSPEESYGIAALVGSLDFDKEYINETYDEEFSIWNIYQAKWFYTKGTFNETANYTWIANPIFKEPRDYANALEAYNDLITDLNREPLIKFLKLIFPRFTPDEFLWELVLNGLIIAKPFNDYLVNLVQELDCSADVRVEQNTLIFRRVGKTILEIEVIFGDRGTQKSFIVKDVYGKVIYEINSQYSSDLVVVYSLFLLIPIIGVISIYLINKHWKKKKTQSKTSASKG